MTGPDLPTGSFSSWLSAMQGALVGRNDAEVACDRCTACCRSSQFVHVEPDETDTLAHIPSDLLFPAPRRPPGHLVLGYDSEGRCPLLAETGCSIYDHRPRTCRTYDCRVLAAAGPTVGSEVPPLVLDRVRRWRFSFPTPGDTVAQHAVRAAATFLDRHPQLVGGGAPSLSATERAVLAVEIHDVFVDGADGRGGPRLRVPTVAQVADALERRKSDPSA